MITDERIAEIRALLENATPGPWRAHPSGWVETANEVPVSDALRRQPHAERDGALIAAAPTIIAELLEEVERLAVRPPRYWCDRCEELEFVCDKAHQKLAQVTRERDEARRVALTRAMEK